MTTALDGLNSGPAHQGVSTQRWGTNTGVAEVITAITGLQAARNSARSAALCEGARLDGGDVTVTRVSRSKTVSGMEQFLASIMYGE